MARSSRSRRRLVLAPGSCRCRTRRAGSRRGGRRRPRLWKPRVSGSSILSSNHPRALKESAQNAPTTSSAVNDRNLPKSISSPCSAYQSIQSSNTPIVALIASSAFSNADILYAVLTSRDMSVFSAGSTTDMGVRKRQSGKRRALYQSPFRSGGSRSFLGPSAWAMLISSGAMRTKGPDVNVSAQCAKTMAAKDVTYPSLREGRGSCRPVGPSRCSTCATDGSPRRAQVRGWCSEDSGSGGIGADLGDRKVRIMMLSSG